MAHFLSTGTLPAAPHTLASGQPRGTHRAAADLGAQEAGAVATMLCDAPQRNSRGDSDTRQRARRRVKVRVTCGLTDPSAYEIAQPAGAAALGYCLALLNALFTGVAGALASFLALG